MNKKTREMDSPLVISLNVVSSSIDLVCVVIFTLKYKEPIGKEEASTPFDDLIKNNNKSTTNLGREHVLWRMDSCCDKDNSLGTEMEEIGWFLGKVGTPVL